MRREPFNRDVRPALSCVMSCGLGVYSLKEDSRLETGTIRPQMVFEFMGMNEII